MQDLKKEKEKNIQDVQDFFMMLSCCGVQLGCILYNIHTCINHFFLLGVYIFLAIMTSGIGLLALQEIREKHFVVGSLWYLLVFAIQALTVKFSYVWKSS